ncbi:hypothetical protein QVD17_17146 [Tagetes erecta]|uniref:Bifunctional inhibitor/plant lipid transfer protein/seed storage helical domain-containing protein n=1 Tax=Tagetes erecta TaxID=13708 RepID=A0AAD8P167_TARER|nr:hypothetical protein QVD17_17146 [Tagetes erecta]
MATTGCRGAITSLSPCLNYVCGNSSSPSISCCSQLANVVKSQPHCLCALVSGAHSSMNFKINQTLALGLPAACSVHTPPVSRCDGNGNGTQAVPIAPPPKSYGTINKLPFYLSFVSLLVALNI